MSSVEAAAIAETVEKVQTDIVFVLKDGQTKYGSTARKIVRELRRPDGVIVYFACGNFVDGEFVVEADLVDLNRSIDGDEFQLFLGWCISDRAREKHSTAGVQYCSVDVTDWIENREFGSAK